MHVSGGFPADVGQGGAISGAEARHARRGVVGVSQQARSQRSGKIVMIEGPLINQWRSQLHRADVAAVAAKRNRGYGIVRMRPGPTALIRGTTTAVALINGRASGLRRPRLCRTAVVLQGAEQRIEETIRWPNLIAERAPATAIVDITNQIKSRRSEHAVAIKSLGRDIAGDNCATDRRASTTVVDSTPGRASTGEISRNCTIGHE